VCGYCVIEWYQEFIIYTVDENVLLSCTPVEVRIVNTTTRFCVCDIPEVKSLLAFSMMHRAAIFVNGYARKLPLPVVQTHSGILLV